VIKSEAWVVWGRRCRAFGVSLVVPEIGDGKIAYLSELGISRMPEAEVSLRLAFWLLERGYADSRVDVAIDGAQVRVGDTVHFDLPRFLLELDCRKLSTIDAWQCEYALASGSGTVYVHSNPACGDVVARLRTGHTLRVECKKGPLTRSPSSQEYPLIREALRQLLRFKRSGRTIFSRLPFRIQQSSRSWPYVGETHHLSSALVFALSRWIVTEVYSVWKKRSVDGLKSISHLHALFNILGKLRSHST
jgi:hypothetical protein